MKAKVAIAQGKKQHDKRDTEKQRDWQRDKAGLFEKRQAVVPAIPQYSNHPTPAQQQARLGGMHFLRSDEMRGA